MKTGSQLFFDLHWRMKERAEASSLLAKFSSEIVITLKVIQAIQVKVLTSVTRWLNMWPFKTIKCFPIALKNYQNRSTKMGQFW